jgi:hypothetical protein
LLQAMQDKEKQWREIQRQTQGQSRRPAVERDW